MDDICSKALLFLVYFVSSAECQAGNHFGVIYAESVEDASQSGSYCMMYNPQFQPVPETKDEATKYPLTDILPSSLCEEPEPVPDFHGAAVAIARGNCTFSQKARLVQDYHGQVALIVSETEMSEPVANSTSDYNEINVTVAVMEDLDFKKLKSLGREIKVQLYAPGMPHVDYNLILIWAMAVGTVFIGGYWSGLVRHKQYMRRVIRHRSRHSQPSAVESDASEQEDEQDTFDASPKVIIFFVVLMCGMLVALYFFYDYLVYVIIGLFCLAASTALYSCLKPFMLRIPFCGKCVVPMKRVPGVRADVEVRRIILALLCLAVGVWWGVQRNAQYAWIVQDILGVAFCIHMMKTIRLPSLKVVTVLLVLLFFYDIFFVFITPLFTKSGESVMVEVATGSGSSTREMLPMVMKVPRFSSTTLSVCTLPFSLLGFGDILVPGLLVAFCHGFDRLTQNSGIYFIASVIGYGVGLLVTFLALALMSQGQPALLYLVPCTLLTTVVIGLCRRELAYLWRGELPKKDDPPKMNGSAPKPPVTCDEMNPPAGGDGNDLNVEVSSLSSDNEQRNLISDRVNTVDVSGAVPKGNAPSATRRLTKGNAPSTTRMLTKGNALCTGRGLT